MPIAFKSTKSICKLFELIICGSYGSRTQISDLIVNRSGFHTNLGMSISGSHHGNYIKDLSKAEHHFSVFFQKVFYTKFYKED